MKKELLTWVRKGLLNTAHNTNEQVSCGCERLLQPMNTKCHFDGSVLNVTFSDGGDIEFDIEMRPSEVSGNVITSIELHS